MQIPQEQCRPGELSRRLVIQAPLYNSPRDEVIGYRTVATVWGAIEPAAGPAAPNSDIKFEAGREIQITDTLVRIRYRPGIDSSMRIVDGTTAYDIRDISNPRTSFRMLYLKCRIVS